MRLIGGTHIYSFSNLSKSVDIFTLPTTKLILKRTRIYLRYLFFINVPVKLIDGTDISIFLTLSTSLHIIALPITKVNLLSRSCYISSL